MQEGLSHEEYRILVEKAPIMIWRADLTMGCDYFNRIWLAFTGRSLEQETGNGWAEGVHPEDFDRCLKIYTDHFATREAFEMEYRLRRFDGAFRWIFDRGVPYVDAEGNFKGYIGSCIDITEGKEAREALNRAHEAELKKLRDVIPICSYCKKIRDDRGYWNQVELYISEQTNTLLSHGMCPDCEKKAIAEFEGFKTKSGR